jgi:hypothetical protein
VQGLVALVCAKRLGQLRRRLRPHLDGLVGQL